MKSENLRVLLIGAFLVVFAALTGCAGALPWNKQQYAGLTEWTVRHDVECLKAVGEKDYLCFELDVIDGKEKQDVTITLERLPTGVLRVSYSATAVKAFVGQALRAEVEKMVAIEIGKAVPLITEAITKAMLDSINPLP